MTQSSPTLNFINVTTGFTYLLMYWLNVYYLISIHGFLLLASLSLGLIVMPVHIIFANCCGYVIIVDVHILYGDVS